MGICISSGAQNVIDAGGNVNDFYKFDKLLYKGNTGKVFLVYNIKTGVASACKSISKRSLLGPDDIEDCRREIQVLLHLSGHPNIVSLHTTFEDKSSIHLIMDLCSGGELFDRIAEKGQFSEEEAAGYIRLILSVVNHCHSMNILHRDIKPEIFLLSDKSQNATLRAADFGLAQFFKEGDKFDEIVGSPFYVAPEVLKRSYSKECDVWSCGVILYILLSGFPPFYGESASQVFKKTLSSPLDLRSEPWPSISEAAKDCVKSMLQKDPAKRPSAAEVLKHPWIMVKGLASGRPIVPEVLVRMRNFAAMNKMKKVAVKVIAQNLPAAEIAMIRQMFTELDADHSGCISVQELREGLRKKGAELAIADVHKMLANIDIDADVMIDCEEFIAATIHASKLSREEHLLTAFQHFDKDNSGFITREELMQAMDKLGESVVDDIFFSVDKSKDGKIDYEEFCAMMLNKDDTLPSGISMRSRVVNEAALSGIDVNIVNQAVLA